MKARKANSNERRKRAPADSEKTRELAELAKKINVKLNGIRDGLRTAVQDAIEAGEMLIKAKAVQDHGCFSKWCQKHFSKVTSRQLQKYMQLAKYVREAKANSSSDLATILEGGIAAALHSFQILEEDLPPKLTRKTAKQFLGIPLDGQEEDQDDDEGAGEDDGEDEGEGKSSDESEDKSSDDRTDQSSGNGEDKSSGNSEARQDEAETGAPDSRGLKKWVQGLYSRADKALRDAQPDGDWSRYLDLIDDATLEQTRQAAEAWTKLYAYLKQLCEQGRAESEKAKADGPPQPSAAQLVPAE
jgi:hypothetical protein